jgi:hypothetical protein
MKQAVVTIGVVVVTSILVIAISDHVINTDLLTRAIALLTAILLNIAARFLQHLSHASNIDKHVQVLNTIDKSIHMTLQNLHSAIVHATGRQPAAVHVTLLTMVKSSYIIRQQNRTAKVTANEISNNLLTALAILRELSIIDQPRRCDSLNISPHQTQPTLCWPISQIRTSVSFSGKYIFSRRTSVHVLGIMLVTIDTPRATAQINGKQVRPLLDTYATLMSSLITVEQSLIQMQSHKLTFGQQMIARLASLLF